MSDQTKNKNSTGKPTHYVRKKTSGGTHSEFDTIGVAWAREEGGLYIKLYGVQVVDGGFYAFPNKES